ncbi:MAG: gliding motility-associated C-terminal domain-containing protein [Saprospiraceae bacterium]|nr:gliding motility-associated C-terminal domain-containing protein [Saprospiraceae bacterium]
MKNKILFLVLLLIPTLTQLHSQCAVTRNITITDLENDSADTTDISIVVQGLLNNNLNDPLQGLCGVAIKFRHPFVKELLIDLISPSGQKIRLVGGTTTAYFTGFVNWDVIFVQSPPEGNASPDPGFSEIWENDQDWENFKTYKGQYFPHTGRLQNFNTGPANGTWTFKCIDLADFGEGLIQNIQLIFCDDTGAACSECRLDPGVFTGDDLLFCEGSSELNLDLIKIYPAIPPVQNNTFIYTNVVFSEDTIHSYKSDTDFRTFAPGIYKVCGLQHSVLDQTLLPPLGTIHSTESVNEYFRNNNACAAVSDSCINITIVNDIAPTKVVNYICAGDEVEMNGEKYNAQGIYIIRIPNGACDSLVELDLRLISIETVIQPDADSLNCFNNVISLIGSNQGTFVNNPSYQWFSTNGKVDTDPTEFIVDISQPGLYNLEISGTAFGLTCRDTASIEIFEDNSVPVTSLSAPILTCAADTVTITLNSSRTINNTIWESVDLNPFQTELNNIRIWNPGKYIVTVVSDNGCSVLDSITVLSDLMVEEPVLTADTLDCLNEKANIIVIHQINRLYSYNWSGVDVGFEMSSSPQVSEPENVKLRLTDLQNGCVDSFDIEIIKEIILPVITKLEVENITCSKLSVQPVIEADMPLTGYLWTGPGLNSISSSPSINNAGTFNVTVTGVNGCKKDTSFVIEIDTLKPVLMLSANPITCQVDSTQLNVTSNQVITGIEWSGPFGFSSLQMSPYVTQAGLYTVIVTTESGCIGTGSVNVTYGAGIPDVLFFIPPITCLKDTTRVTALTPPGNYSFNWDGPALSQTNIAFPFIFAPGEYRITVTDIDSGCTSVSRVNVLDERVYPTATLTSEIINCVKDSVQIILIPDLPLSTVNYTGPDDFISSQQSPFIKKEGWYYVTYTNALMCSRTDSILIERNDEFPVLNVPDVVFKCKQDSIAVVGQSTIAGTTFQWSNSESFNKSGAEVFVYKGGTYTLRGTAPNQCKDSIQFTIGYDTISPTLSINTPDILTCRDPEIILTALSDQGVTFIWSEGNVNTTTLTVTEPKDYTVTATGSNNCESSFTVSVLENKTFPVFSSIASTINCKDALSLVIVTPENVIENITWANDNPVQVSMGSLSFNTPLPGIYKFSVINEEQCVSEGSVSVFQDKEVPNILSVISDSITCTNPSINIGFIVEKPVFSYIWNGPGFNFVSTDNIITVTEGGVYEVTITGANFCVKDSFIQVIKNREIPEFTTFSDTLTCEKGKINIGVNPISNIVGYLWGGNDLISNSRNPIVFIPGLYTVTVTNSNGCTAVGQVDVPSNFVKPEFEMRDTILLPCDSSTIALFVTSSEIIVRYKWTFPDGTVNNNNMPLSDQPGEYQVQVVGENGCPSEIKQFTAIIDTRPPGFKYTTDTITCEKPLATLSATSDEMGVTYKWIGPTGLENSEDNFQTTIGGIYKLIVTNENKCNDSIIFSVPSDTISPIAIITQSGSIQCESRIVRLNTTVTDENPFLIYQWDSQNGTILSNDKVKTITVNQPGIYRLEIFNPRNGCNSEQEYILIEELPQLTTLEADIRDPLCVGFKNGKITLDNITGRPPYTITVNGQDFGNVRSYSFLAPGNYLINIIDSLGCRLDTILTVKEGSDFTIRVPEIVYVNFGDSILLIPEISDLNNTEPEIQWTKGNEIICENCEDLWVRPFINTVYTVRVSLDGQCTQSAKVLVSVNNNLDQSVPNIFNPESTQGNNIFYIPQTRGIEKILSVKIFDRWAEAMYYSTEMVPGDNSIGWDGTYKGKNVQPGVFVLIIEMQLSDGTYYKYIGDLTLIR